MLAPSTTTAQIQGPDPTTPSSSWGQAGYTEHQEGPRAGTEPHSQVDTQSACITHPQKIVFYTPRDVASGIPANTFQRNQYLHTALSEAMHNYIQSKRRLFEGCGIYWPRQFCNAPSHHFGASFSRFFRKLHQFTNQNSIFNYYCHR